MAESKRAIGLVRCSTDQQEHSTGDQEAEIRRWCGHQELDLVRVFEDEGVSGSVLDRPGLLALLRYVESHPEGGTLVVWRRNRLARAQDPLDGLLIERRIEKAGWKIHCLHGRNGTGDAFMDRLVGLLEHHQAGEFLRSLATDTLRGQLRTALEGGMLVGVVPYGYQRRVQSVDGSTRILDRRSRFRRSPGDKVAFVAGAPEEVAVVKRIFSAYSSARLSTSGLVRELNAEGVPGPRGGTWTETTLRHMLRNPVYTGALVWNRAARGKFARIVGGKIVKSPEGRAASKDDSVVIPGHHEPLVDAETFAAVQALIAKRGKKSRGKYATRAHPLSGLVKCGACGSLMTVTRFDKRGPVYVCKGYRTGRTCEAYMVVSTRLEGEVLRVLQEALLPLRANLKPRLHKLLSQRLGVGPSPALDRLKRELATLERKIDGGLDRLVLLPERAATQLADKIQGWTTRKVEVEHELERLEAKRQQATDLDVLVDEIARLLDDLGSAKPGAPPDELRVLFERLVCGIELDFISVPPKTGTRMRRKLKGGRVALPEALAVASNILPQPTSLVQESG